MKKIITILAAMALTLTAFAQTAEEIVARMDEVMSQLGEDSGMRMTMDIKIPILGTMSTTAYVLGDKMRMEAAMMGKNLVTWQDGETEWTYDADENTVTIGRRDKPKKAGEKENRKMFQSATEGYDVSIAKETAEAWTIKCKKNRSNTKKDDPKTMELVIAKGTYYPMSLSAKVDMVGVTIRNLDFNNVSEKQVTFNQADYPGARIIDKR